MSYQNYDQYGGNPYQSSGGYATSDPYGTQATSTTYTQQQTGYGAQTASQATSTPYTTAPQQEAGMGHIPGQGGANPNSQPGVAYGGQPGVAYGGQPGVVYVEAPPTTLSNQDFLSRVEGTRGDIRQLTTNISELGMLHQRALSDPSSNHAQLENLVTRTQVLNTKIKDQIRYLETDALKDGQNGKNTTKDTQIRTLKGYFKSQLQEYQTVETQYRKRYEEQIGREYKIVNPNASDAEVQEAMTADWGSEGVFQTALKSNRTAAANSVLGNVRARHNDIQRIEKTLIELAQMFNDLAQEIAIQEKATENIEDQTGNTLKETEQANNQLTKANKSAANRRKLKWWCFGIVVLIIVILALVLGLYFGLPNAGYHAANRQPSSG